MISASSMHEAGHSKLHGTMQRDEVGREAGGGFRIEGHLYTHA